MDNARFEKARLSVLTKLERERHGIGMQMEKTLHAVFKNYEDPDEDHQEIPVIGNFIADIFTGTEIIEIQNGNFNKMRDKLAAFLPLYPVRIVYPIPHEKYITWVDPETGALGKRNRSSKRGTFYEAFRQLYMIRPFLSDPNLTVDLILTDIEEYRLQDGWGNGGKRGSHRFDRIPTALADELILSGPVDYLAFVPFDLKEPFTAKELASKARIRSCSPSEITLLLTEIGILTRVGKRGRSYLYEIAAQYKDED